MTASYDSRNCTKSDKFRVKLDGFPLVFKIELCVHQERQDTTHVTGSTMKLLISLVLVAVINPPTIDDPTLSVLDSGSQPILLDNGPVIVHQDTVLEKPIISELPVPAAIVEPAIENIQPLHEHAPLYRGPAIVSNPVLLHRPAPVKICTACKCTVCCCKTKSNRKVETNLNLVDPTGCVHHACVQVPVCCLNEAPRVSWKGRLFGRQVATLCWDCCDFEAKVVVTRRGKVRVRD